MKDFSVGSDKITTEGFGESKPVADNSTADGRAKNRRADIIVETEEKEAQFK